MEKEVETLILFSGFHFIATLLQKTKTKYTYIQRNTFRIEIWEYFFLDSRLNTRFRKCKYHKYSYTSKMRWIYLCKIIKLKFILKFYCTLSVWLHVKKMLSNACNLAVMSLSLSMVIVVTTDLTPHSLEYAISREHRYFHGTNRTMEVLITERKWNYNYC